MPPPPRIPYLHPTHFPEVSHTSVGKIQQIPNISPPKKIQQTPNISPPKKQNFHRPSPLPDGMFDMTGKRCPKGSKTIKHKGINVCKKNTSVKKPKSISPSPTKPKSISPSHINQGSPLPEGLLNMIGKRCPKGSKTYKYKEKMVCKTNTSVKKQKSLSPNLGDGESLPEGMIQKTGGRCPKGYKSFKYKNQNVCKKE